MFSYSNFIHSLEDAAVLKIHAFQNLLTQKSHTKFGKLIDIFKL
jgi:hypothetical protein